MHKLTDYYHIMGGKTGTLKAEGAYNLVALVEVPGTDDWLACAILGAKEPNKSPNNRFVAMKQAVDAAQITVTEEDIEAIPSRFYKGDFKAI